MRQTPRPRNLYTLLATMMVIICTLWSPPMALAKGCNEGSPAVPVPQTLWGELEPVRIILDTTRYNGSPRADSNYPLINWVDIENGYLFATYWGGLQIWDARGSNATQPVRLSQADGWSGHFPAWIAGNAEIDQYVYGSDAPEGTDSLLAVAGLEPVGLSIWDTSDKTAPKALYQDTTKSFQQVYTATIGGRAYAFGAGFLGNAGVHIYDMTQARNYSRCVDNCPGVYLGKIGSSVTTYVHGMQFGNKHFIVRSTGNGGRPWAVEIWNVTTPSSPSLVVGGLNNVFAAGLAMWEHQGSAYLGVRTVNRLKVYNVTSCLSSGCSSLPTLTADLPIHSTPDSDYWKPLSFSRSGTTPFLFVGHGDLCHDRPVPIERHTEYLFDMSNPASPRDITPGLTLPLLGRPVDYWSWYYSDEVSGFSFSAPRGGKFNGPYFYRADLSIFDIHKWTGGASTAPDANFTWSPSEVYPGDTVAFTDTSSGVVTSRLWTFQDGTPSSGTSSPQNVSFGSAGNKTVQLQATRDGVGSDTETKTVTVLDPSPVINSVAPTLPQTLYACQPVTFTAAATGRPALSYNWKVLNPTNATGVTGTGSTFQWDGKVNGVAAVPGQYRGEVTVQNASGAVTGLSAAITIVPFDPLPNAGFAIINDAFASGTVQFHAPTTGVTSWQWDFDDDANENTDNWGPVLTDPVTGPNPSHSYTSIGQRKVRVRVSNCATPAAIQSTSLSINITEIAPLRINLFQAQCNVAPCFFGVGETITFAQSVEGDPNSYQYDWDGNGSFEQTSATPVTTHSYSAGGSYAPKMRIVRGTEAPVDRTHPEFVVAGTVVPPPPPPGPSISIGGASSGQINTAIALTATATNCSASANGWTWTAGGGTLTGSGNAVSITWSSVGSKTVTAKNSACLSATGTKTVTITEAAVQPGPGGLTASFSFLPATPSTGTAVTFDASASAGTPTIYAWDFGDGQTGNSSTPTTTHTYQAAGNYQVKLEVGKPGQGCAFSFCSATFTKAVAVTGPSGPAASFTTSATCVSEFGFTSCTAATGTPVTFTSTSTGATTYSWKFGDGGTATGPAVSHTWTQAGPYEVELTASNGSLTSVSRKGFEVTGQATASTKSVVLPWIAQTRGALNQSSDLYVHNPGAIEMEVKLQFRKRGVPESTPPESTKKIAPGATLFVADALDDLFSRENVAGFITITVVKGDVEPVITSFNTTFQPDGSQFGQTVPGFSMSRTGGASGTGATSPVQHLVGLNDNSERLAYFGISNPSDQPVTYRLRFFDNEGHAIGTPGSSFIVSRFGQRQFQVSEIRETFGINDADDYRIEIETVTGGGLVPYASNLRLASDDPSFVGGRSVQAAKVYLIGALSSPGPNNSLWQSDVVLSNTSNEVVLTDMTFTPVGLNSATTPEVTLTLPKGATERLVNVIAEKWNIRNTAGVLILDSNATGGAYPVVQGESYDNSTPAKRFGQTLPALTDADAAGPGKSHILAGLRQDAKNRTTYWVYSSGTEVAEFDIIYRNLDGSIINRINGVRLGAGKARQFSPAQHPLPAAGVPNGFTVQFAVRAGKVLSAAQVVNNATNDPAYVQGEVR
jgi:PKD repeat protein